MRTSVRCRSWRMRLISRRPASGLSITTSSRSTAISVSRPMMAAASAALCAWISCSRRPHRRMSCRAKSVASWTSSSSSTTSSFHTSSLSTGSAGGASSVAKSMISSSSSIAFLFGKRVVRRDQRQQQLEQDATARRSRQLDAAAKYRRGQVIDDIQPQPAAAAAQLGGEKWVEDLFGVGGVDPDAIVGIAQGDQAVGGRFGRDPDGAGGDAVKSVQQGIGDQVGDDLLDRTRIAFEDDAGWHIDFQAMFGLLEFRLQGGQHLVDGLAQIETAAAHAGLIDGDLLEVADQIGRALRISLQQGRRIAAIGDEVEQRLLAQRPI